jgi:predicted tellurium resistance membrane protein TerC
LIADLVMSLDNVIAVAAAAGGSLTLLIIGLAISIPLVVFGATLLVHLMERFPVIITLGAALIGLVAGEMLITDPVLTGWMKEHFAAVQFEDGKPKLGAISLELAFGLAGALLVVIWGRWLARRQAAGQAEAADAGAPPNS